MTSCEYNLWDAKNFIKVPWDIGTYEAYTKESGFFAITYFVCHPIDSLLGTSQWSNKSEQFFFLMDPFKNESVMIGDLDELENTSSQPDERVSVSRYLILPLLDETVIKSWDCFQELLPQHQIRDHLNCDPSVLGGATKKHQSQKTLGHEKNSQNKSVSWKNT